MVACLDTDTYVVDVQATSDGTGRMRLSVSEMEWDFWDRRYCVVWEEISRVDVARGCPHVV